jgi:hypothetical protein
MTTGCPHINSALLERAKAWWLALGERHKSERSIWELLAMFAESERGTGKAGTEKEARHDAS